MMYSILDHGLDYEIAGHVRASTFISALILLGLQLGHSKLLVGPSKAPLSDPTSAEAELAYTEHILNILR